MSGQRSYPEGHDLPDRPVRSHRTAPEGAAMSADESEITFPATLELLGERPILRLPQAASDRLPSRGQVAVGGSIGGTDFTTVVEPDGRRGHWISIDDDLWQRLESSAGDEVAVSLSPRRDWPEVTVPQDLRAALAEAGDLENVWQSLTPMARWEWVRWIKATKNADTRARRVDVAISKLESGKRRPCWFDLTSCTNPELSKHGKLLGISWGAGSTVQTSPDSSPASSAPGAWRLARRGRTVRVSPAPRAEAAAAVANSSQNPPTRATRPAPSSGPTSCPRFAALLTRLRSRAWSSGSSRRSVARARLTAMYAP